VHKSFELLINSTIVSRNREGNLFSWKIRSEINKTSQNVRPNKKPK